MDKIKVGILFGGPAKEREVSFAGGRTVYDNLDKQRFTPIPIFIDSYGRFIHINWQFIYKGSIRDFYPTPELKNHHKFQPYIESLDNLNENEANTYINAIGKEIYPHQLNDIIDFAFLALHGPYGEDGTIQGLLSWYGIPFSGTDMLGSALAIDKVVQKKWLSIAGFNIPSWETLSRKAWKSIYSQNQSEKLMKKLGASLEFPLVVKTTTQGSSLGISIIKKPELAEFIKAIQQAFFIRSISPITWKNYTLSEKMEWINALMDVRSGIGLPVSIQGDILTHPHSLLCYLNELCQAQNDMIVLEHLPKERTIIVESFIKGREFSCIVVSPTPGEAFALTPTEMIMQGQSHLDYRAKYLPGIIRKRTPISLDTSSVTKIRKACEKLFLTLNCQVYARIDGFITEKNEIYLNDPNTTAGMNPSSFLFQQAAMVGLDPKNFLSFIIDASLQQRTLSISTQNNTTKILQLTTSSDSNRKLHPKKLPVAVLMGGFTEERHISFESGRNVYEKLASSTLYEPIPIFLSGTLEKHTLYILPIHLLLKDNADDVHEILNTLADTTDQRSFLLKDIRDQAKNFTEKYIKNPIFIPRKTSYKELAEKVKFIFLALHGSPGEDGTIQALLEKYGLPYNGSGISSSKLMMNKYNTNQFLKQNNVKVASQFLVTKKEWLKNKDELLQIINNQYTYPIIVKPVDEGCSAAILKIKNQLQLENYAEIIFSKKQKLSSQSQIILNLSSDTVFPHKNEFLIESLVEKGEADYFLEITGGLLTHMNTSNAVQYEIFSPSETLASGEILSLEEKFLAGQGQNITPARFHPTPKVNQEVMKEVKSELKRVAKLLHIEGYARIDAFVKVFEQPTLSVEVWIIEPNTLPAMTPATCIFHQCALNGYTPFDFIHHIIQYGLKRFNKNK